MPKCPKCDKETETLTEVETKKTTAIFYGEQDYDVIDTEVVSEIWSCPECGEQLFDSEDKAEEFFRKEEEHGED